MGHAVVHITAFTHHGQVRDNNEDSIAVDRWVRNAPMSSPRQWRFALEGPVACILADGMGGHAAGEVASRHVAERLSQEALRISDPEMAGTLLQTINAELYEMMRADPSRAGMGSTVAAFVISSGRLIWFNIGDSRLYQHRNGYLRQISVDDVPGPVPDQNPNAKRLTTAITQSLGGTKSIQHPVPHIGILDLPVPSRWLLCSDGVTDPLDVDAMELCMAAPDHEAVAGLIDAAIKAGGDDNLSCIVLNASFEPPLVSRE